MESNELVLDLVVVGEPNISLRRFCGRGDGFSAEKFFHSLGCRRVPSPDQIRRSSFFRKGFNTVTLPRWNHENLDRSLSNAWLLKEYFKVVGSSWMRRIDDDRTERLAFSKDGGPTRICYENSRLGVRRGCILRETLDRPELCNSKFFGTMSQSDVTEQAYAVLDLLCYKQEVPAE
jgi:hypothetical protein